MSLMLTLSAEIVGLLATISACYVLLLLYRNPFRPRWLDREFASSILTITAISLLILVTAWFVKSLVLAEVDPLASLAILAALFLAASWGLWKLMGMRWRLRQAAEGRSPFAARGRRGGLPGGGLAEQG